MKKHLFIFVSLTLLLSACCDCNAVSVSYNFDQPDSVTQLPEILNEISGMAITNQKTIACVQDELGTIFFYSLKDKKIVEKKVFEKEGDFEGLALVGKRFYVLRSDGRLSGVETDVTHYQLKLETDDNEGLCYDAKNHRLLITGKSASETNKKERYIYDFDLEKKALRSKKAYVFNTDELLKEARKRSLPEFSISKKGKKKKFNFRPAAIAIHPMTDQIYILSSSDKLLLIIDRSGKVMDFIKLDRKKYLQPESLSFLDDGTLIIASEAHTAKPLLFTLKPKVSEEK